MQDCCKNELRLKTLSPGVRVCPAGHMHIFLDEMCIAAGYPPTAENLQMLADECTAIAEAARGGKKIKVELVDD